MLCVEHLDSLPLSSPPPPSRLFVAVLERIRYLSATFPFLTRSPQPPLGAVGTRTMATARKRRRTTATAPPPPPPAADAVPENWDVVLSIDCGTRNLDFCLAAVESAPTYAARRAAMGKSQDKYVVLPAFTFLYEAAIDVTDAVVADHLDEGAVVAINRCTLGAITSMLGYTMTTRLEAMLVNTWFCRFPPKYVVIESQPRLASSNGVVALLLKLWFEMLRARYGYTYGVGLISPAVKLHARARLPRACNTDVRAAAEAYLAAVAPLGRRKAEPASGRGVLDPPRTLEESRGAQRKRIQKDWNKEFARQWCYYLSHRAARAARAAANDGADRDQVGGLCAAAVRAEHFVHTFSVMKKKDDRADSRLAAIYGVCLGRCEEVCDGAPAAEPQEAAAGGVTSPSSSATAAWRRLPGLRLK